MFGARGALHLNVLMNTSDVPLQILSVEHLRTERAIFAHIMNSFDVSCQKTCMELLRTERAMFAHVIVNFFDCLSCISVWELTQHCLR